MKFAILTFKSFSSNKFISRKEKLTFNKFEVRITVAETYVYLQLKSARTILSSVPTPLPHLKVKKVP